MTGAAAGKIYGAYTLTELERQYDIEASVAEMGSFLRSYSERSAATRARRRSRLDLAYGQSPAETLDLYFAEASTPAPVLVFIHGGGWRSSSKETRAFLADFYCPAGAVFVSLEYPLAPAHTLDEIADAVRRGLAWVEAHADAFGGDAGRIVVAGNSAGGHLAAAAATGPQRSLLAGVVTVSGAFDMKPLQLTTANSWLRMDDEAVLRHSPIRHIPSNACPLLAFVGQEEPDEFRRQSRDFAQAWKKRGGRAEYQELPGQNHFSVIGLIGEAGNPISGGVLQLLGLPGA